MRDSHDRAFQPTTSSLRHPEEIADLEVLSDDECWTILQHASIGRVALRAGDGVDIFPVNFLVHDRRIFLRSAPGSKLVDMTTDPHVAFEVDGTRWRAHYSVVVHGFAARLSSDDEIERSGVLNLHTDTTSAKFNYVQITPTTLTGRRFRLPSPVAARPEQ